MANTMLLHIYFNSLLHIYKSSVMILARFFLLFVIYLFPVSNVPSDTEHQNFPDLG